MSDHRGVTSYVYDGRGRLTVVSAPEGNVAYGYDDAGRVSSLTTAAGTTAYVRDALGRIVQVTDPAGGVYAIGRDDAGRVTSVAFPNGVTEAYTYDAAGRPLTVTVTDALDVELASFAATRDQVGRITALNDSVAGTSVSRDFGYDAAGRLTQVVSDATGAPSTTDYTLDGLGNRTVTTVDGAAEPATVNDLDQLTALGSAAFTYDAAGRLTSATGTAGTTTYAWTSQGELAQVATPSVTVDYEYDLAGNITTRTEDGTAVEFVYDSLTGLPRAVSASDGSWWVYVDGVPLAQHIPATLTTTGATAYLHTDIRGDVRLATDATGTVSDTWTYTVDGALVARTGTTDVSVGWRGETHDTATGLIWLRARWYDPTTARFLSADPWHGNPANPASLNRYVYGNADPVNLHDPTGFTAVPVGIADVSIAQVIAKALYAMRWYLAAGVVALLADQGLLTRPTVVDEIDYVDPDLDPDDPRKEPGRDRLPDTPPLPVPWMAPAGLGSAAGDGDQVVYRVWGGISGPYGASWTPVNPIAFELANGSGSYREASGIPSGNTAQFVTTAILHSEAAIVEIRPALPIFESDGYVVGGGLVEYIIPGGCANIQMTCIGTIETRSLGTKPEHIGGYIW